MRARALGSPSSEGGRVRWACIFRTPGGLLLFGRDASRISSSSKSPSSEPGLLAVCCGAALTVSAVRTGKAMDGAILRRLADGGVPLDGGRGRLMPAMMVKVRSSSYASVLSTVGRLHCQSTEARCLSCLMYGLSSVQHNASASSTRAGTLILRGCSRHSNSSECRQTRRKSDSHIQLQLRRRLV